MKNPDFLIIGGGILGCAIAWNLARRSKSKVLLLERQELATAATSKAAGLIRKIGGKKEQIPLNYLTEENCQADAVGRRKGLAKAPQPLHAFTTFSGITLGWGCERIFHRPSTPAQQPVASSVLTRYSALLASKQA